MSLSAVPASDAVHTVSRRGLLGAGLALAAAGALSGCRSSSTAASTQSANRAVQLPTYVERAGARPDLPAGADGVRPGFYSYPIDDVATTVDQVPGAGGAIRYQTFNFSPSPVPRERNLFWQDMERRLGVTWDYDGVPGENFLAKVQTTIAGGDLPECMTFGSSAFVTPQLPRLLEAKFTDLSEHLSGDKIKDYPNLAGISTPAWQGTVFNGGIYGVPRMQATISGQYFIHADRFEAVGVTKNPTTPDDMIAAFAEVNAPKQGAWAVTGPGTALAIAKGLTGAGYGWKLVGDDLVSVLESDAYVAALELAAAMNAKGLLHPDGATADGNVLFTSGKGLTTIGSANAWTGNYNTLASTGHRLGAWMPYLADGSVAPMAAAPAYAFFMSIKKGLSSDQVREILRVADYCAAPFGSAEEKAISYGVEGHDYTLVSGQPTPSDTYAKEAPLGLNYFANASLAVINSAHREQVDLTHAYETAAAPHLTTEPTIGLYSETNDRSGAVLSKMISTFETDVVLGRKSAGDFRTTVLLQWKSRGGDAIAREYTAARRANG